MEASGKLANVEELENFGLDLLEQFEGEGNRENLLQPMPGSKRAELMRQTPQETSLMNASRKNEISSKR